MVRKMLGLGAGLMMLLAASTGVAQASPNGVWELDSHDTRIELALCGDGTQLCGTLVWLSDVDYNKQYEQFLNKPVANAIKQSGPNRWQGGMQLFGHKIAGTITQQSETQMTLQGCALLVICKSYQMNKVSP